MSEHAGKGRRRKRTAEADEIARKGAESFDGPNRHAASVAQRRISDAANSSEQVKQIQSLQNVANGSPNAPVQRQIGPKGEANKTWVVTYGPDGKRRRGRIKNVDTKGVPGFRTVIGYGITMDDGAFEVVKPDDDRWSQIDDLEKQQKAKDIEGEEVEAAEPKEDLGKKLKGGKVETAQALFEGLKDPVTELGDALSNLSGAIPKKDYKRSGLDSCVSGLDTLASKADKLSKVFPPMAAATKTASSVIGTIKSALDLARTAQAAKDPENQALLTFDDRMSSVTLAIKSIAEVLDGFKSSEDYGEITAAAEKLIDAAQKMAAYATEITKKIASKKGKDAEDEGSGMGLI